MEEMDMMAGKDAELQQEGNKPVNYQNITNASMASVGNTAMDLSASSAAPMIDSFGPFVWEHRLDAPNFGYSDMNFHDAATSISSPSIRADMGLHQDLAFTKDIPQPSFPTIMSQRVPHLPTDSDFIERAARLSSFGGTFAQMLIPFPHPQSMNPFALKPATGMQSQRDEKDVAEDRKFLKNGTTCGSLFVKHFDEAKCGAGVYGNESDDAEHSQERQLNDMEENSIPKGLDSKKKRKHAEQDKNKEAVKLEFERKKESEDTKPIGGKNLTTTSAFGGKHAKTQCSDLPKEGYVHIRARRGQATNSHSLAERVRREKISERMKFLQDLVPGCNKVTGKAVMLDEIINYVQSLQRQIEFLSMKLATVYPHMDVNLEEYASKNGFQSHSAEAPFPAALHSPQHGLTQMGTSPLIIRTPMNLLPDLECGSLREPAPQVPNVWEDELHNIVHMGLNSSVPSSQDVKGSSH